jgi:hypothetical protein
MPELKIPDPNGMISQLLVERSVETGRPVQELAVEALLRGLTASPAQRSAEAARIRAMGPPLKDDSTDLIRLMRDAG